MSGVIFLGAGIWLYFTDVHLLIRLFCMGLGIGIFIHELIEGDIWFVRTHRKKATQ
jgi:hypothetical protein